MQGVTTILYIRHGETAGNDAKDPLTYTYTGCQTDRPLLAIGHRQAEECANRLQRLQELGVIGKICAIFSSKLIRAVQTAETIAGKLDLKNEQVEDLREINWGVADGQLCSEMGKQWKDTETAVKNQYVDLKNRWDHLPVFPEAETFNSVLERNTKTISHLAKQHMGKTIVVAGHGRNLKTLIAYALNKEEGIPYPANCGIALFTYSREDGLRFVKVLEE